ncbi:toxin [Pseudomonas sp. NPDC089408]|uniref:toxin n=1 Tax=Pseudomonas sp. NPDC089408 TaxID=3364465 RepID=UPI0038303AAF
MEAIFFETSFFTATVSDYLSDDEYKALQQELLMNPECGDVMPRTGGFRKLRWGDRRRGKGKRGGLRVIYYWLSSDGQMWMFAIYDKDELENLTCDQERALKQAITVEVEARKAKRSVKQRGK